MACGPPKYGIRTPPPFMPYELFLLGVRVAFNLLRIFDDVDVIMAACQILVIEVDPALILPCLCQAATTASMLLREGESTTSKDPPDYQNIPRGRANREVQTVNWEGDGLQGLSRGVSRAAWKRRINRELEAKKAHKPWIREGLNRAVQTVN